MNAERDFILNTLTVSQIDELTPAGLYNELCRLLAGDADGGSVRVERGYYTIFTYGSQHVTAPSLDLAIKKALVMEKFGQDKRELWSTAEYREWVRKNAVPAHLTL